MQSTNVLPCMYKYNKLKHMLIKDKKICKQSENKHKSAAKILSLSTQ